jgi:hypothetical protein
MSSEREKPLDRESFGLLPAQRTATAKDHANGNPTHEETQKKTE